MDLLLRLRRKTWPKPRNGMGSIRHPLSSRPRRHHFFRLPPEVRDMIYTELLTRPQISEIWIKYHGAVFGWIDMTGGRRILGPLGLDLKALSTSLLLVNRTMYKEASRILYGRNTIVVGGTRDEIADFLLALTPWTRSVIRSVRLWIEARTRNPCSLSIRPNPHYRLKRQRRERPPRPIWRWYWGLKYTLSYVGIPLLLHVLMDNPDTDGKVYREVIGNDTYHCGPVTCRADYDEIEYLEWSQKSPHSETPPLHDAGWRIIRQLRFLLQELEDFREESITIQVVRLGAPFDVPYVSMVIRSKNFRAT